MFGRKNKNVVDDRNTNNSQEKYTMKDSYNADDLYLARFKWVSSEVTDFGPMDKETEIKAKEIAIKIYKILKCKDFARVDLFYTKSGEIYFNEVNTIPGFTTHSRYPNMMKESGIKFFELVNKIIDLEV